MNDGVRLNLRPFLAVDLPGGRKSASLLRTRPNIHWRKDRGREPFREQERFPWFWRDGELTGERVMYTSLTRTNVRVGCGQRQSNDD